MDGNSLVAFWWEQETNRSADPGYGSAAFNLEGHIALHSKPQRQKAPLRYDGPEGAVRARARSARVGAPAPPRPQADPCCGTGFMK